MNPIHSEGLHLILNNSLLREPHQNCDQFRLDESEVYAVLYDGENFDFNLMRTDVDVYDALAWVARAFYRDSEVVGLVVLTTGNATDSDGVVHRIRLQLIVDDEGVSSYMVFADGQQSVYDFNNNEGLLAEVLKSVWVQTQALPLEV